MAGFRESGMDGGRSEFGRPASLALMGIAAVGWLVAIYFWQEGVSLRADGEEAQRRAEVARQELVGELQAIQRAVGSAAELRQRLDTGRKALDDAVAQRTSVQMRSRRSHPQGRRDGTFARLRVRRTRFEDRAAEGHDRTISSPRRRSSASLPRRRPPSRTNLEKAQAALADAQARARAADASALAAKTAETDARAKAEALAKAADEAQARLDAIEAQIQAKRNPPTPAPSPTPSPSPTP